MKNNFHSCLVSATHSGEGKTTVALALTELARRKGMAVQPFKAGPDYIDPGFHHAVAAPRKSRNLDFFLTSQEAVWHSYLRSSADADFSVVEGMMGLFDGKSHTGKGSSAEIALLLGLPVILVIDGAGLASSAAAIVHGFKTFDPALALAGVIFNRVKTDSHFQWLKTAVESKTRVPCLGYLPPLEAFRIPERHLGLTTEGEMAGWLERFRGAVDTLEKTLDWEAVMGATLRPERPLSVPEAAAKKAACRIGVARDKAFSFYYEDNLDLLRREGAELVFFSPLADAALPEGLDLLYFGGGFPEVHAAALGANSAMAESVRGYHARGGRIYAECGGLIYLVQLGLLPGTVTMKDRLQHFGYHEIETAQETFLFPAGARLRSHEFHYSAWEPGRPVPPAYRVGDRGEGYADAQIVASYQHLHFAGCPEVASRFVSSGAAV